MKRKVFFGVLLSLVLMIWIALAASADGKTFADSADGSKDNPYVISNETDWNAFCDLLAGSEKGFFSGKIVKLGADIGTAEAPVTHMAGGSGHDFTGTFDGNGHTLTVKYGSADSPNGSNYTAPFNHVENGCMIENLHVSGDIYSSAMYAGGLVGSQYGTVTIRNCHVSAVIHSYTTSGDPCHGGFVGYNGASLTIEGCLFDGKLLTEGEMYMKSCAGFVGWQATGENLSFTDCLYAPAPLHAGEVEPNQSCRTFVRNSNATRSFTNCYYTRPLGGAQGMAARSITEEEGITVAVSGEPTGEYNVSGITAYAKGIVWNNKIYCGDVYTIHTAEGWNLFCDLLAYNDKDFFTGKTVKLDDDITVTRMAGGDQHDFCGTFDGQAHTLTFNCGSADSPVSEAYIAPFRYVSNVGTAAATIQNLRVAGDIYTSAKYAAGFIGRLWGTVNIENCRSSVVIHSSVDGDGTHGGFVPENNSAPLNITGCVFDGKLLTTGSTTSCGGFVGFGGNETQVFISNSLYAPAAIGAGETEVLASGSATFNRTGATLANSYYTRALGAEQGTAARSVTGAEGVTVAVSPVGEPTGEYDVSGITVYAKGIVWNGTFYYGNGDEVSLTLGHGDAPEGYTYNGYTVNAGALAGSGNPYTLTMPDRDVTVTAFLPIVPYLDWDEASRTLVERTGEDALKYYTVVCDTTTVWEDGWYVVNQDVQIDDRIEVKGTVNLILCDDATLTAKAGITVEGSNSLTVFAQSTGDKMGTLYAGTTDGTDDTCAASCAGIGSASNHAGEITINGGAIIARGGGSGNRGAGIGGNRYNNCGAITINSGNVNATGSNYAPGIGNGPDVESTGGKVTVNGGAVQASSAGNAAGIGTGMGGAACDVVITGGTIEATGGDRGAGIGGGNQAETGNIAITGGSVTATGNSYGAGIGGGYKSKTGGTIAISGAETVVEVTGGYSAAGIGGGCSCVEAGAITISGGKEIIATGGVGGAGIGAGPFNLKAGDINISGGQKIIANGGIWGDGIGGGYIELTDGYVPFSGNVSISGGTIEATGYGAGIGGGSAPVNRNGIYGSITITGGNITATGSGTGDVTPGAGAGIGGGANCDIKNITISGDDTVIKATGGPNAPGIGQGYGAKNVPEITVSGGAIEATGGENAAGIGGGNGGAGGNVTVSGGTVTATGGGDSVPGIGGGAGSTDDGALNVAQSHVVYSNGNAINDGNKDGSKYILQGEGTDKALEITRMRYMLAEQGQVPVHDPVPYLDWNGEALVERTGEDACKDYAVFRDNTTEWENGWYVVDRDVQIDDRIEVQGTVNLILCDDATLTAKAGITVEGSNSLTLFAQSTGDKKGTLYAGTTDGADNTCAASCAGIGSASEHAGEITINGGAIIARGGGSGIRGAGIGGNQTHSCGAITINSGSVNATGSKYAAGIGNGPDNGDTAGKVSINGGAVQASSAGDGAGIGGGTNGASPNIEITGGTVEASSAEWGAGIGGGYYSGDTYFADPGSVTISGGTIRATGGANGPGIGCTAGGAGKRCSYSGITITGGDITATGGDHGAGIGCGQNGDVIKIEIGGSGTVIHAQGGAQASGIGGGFRSNNAASSPKGQIIIAGGDITANGGNAGAGIGGGYENGNSSSNGISVSISGGTINATGGENGAGIGCGDYDSAIATNSPGVDIGITGGDITATGGMRSAGIGQSRNVKGGKVTISGESTMVTAHGGNWAAGIGGGNYSACESITIDGGTVNADSPGTGYGAGIGGGGHTSGGTITINGGTIHAGSARYGAGIGGGGDNGNNSDGGTTIVIIHGGEVTATGSRGNDDGTYYGAGIGGGGSKVSTGSVTVTIDGGTVVATGAAGGPGIGAGYGGVPTNVALGWTPDAQGKAPALPSVTADRYAGTVKIEKNFKYMDGDGKVPVMITDALDDPDAIANRTLTPANLNAITVTAAEHGSVQASASVQFEGDDVTLTVIPEAGYRLESISATDANGGDVALTGTGDTRGFTMPDKAVTVTSAFGLIPPTITVQPASKELVYGYEDGGALAVEATCHEALTPGWQWYSCDGNGENGVPIDTAAEPTAATSSYRIPAGKNEGTYTYYCVVTASLNGQTATAASGLATVTVAPAGSASAAVTANNRPYDGTEQALVTVDDSTLVGGRMNYALGANATTAPAENLYTTSIPTATDAGTYYVWYKAVGDENHNDTAEECVEVSIAKKKAENLTVVLKESDLEDGLYEFTDSQLTDLVTAVKDGENTLDENDYEITYQRKTGEEWIDVPAADVKRAGAYKAVVRMKDDAQNYEGEVTAEFSIVETKPRIVAHSLILSGTIGVRFFVKIPDEKYVDQSSCSMTFKIYKQTGEQKVDFSEAEKVRVSIDDEIMDLYVFNCYVNSVQMADTITAELKYKEMDSEGKYKDAEEPLTQTYSVREYIRQFRAASNQYNQKTRDLVRALGEYGYYAQQYLSELRQWTLGTGEDADHIAMNDYGYTPRTYSAEEKTAAAQAVAGNKVSASLCSKIESVSYNLLLDSDTRLCVYFKPKSTYSGGATATVDGKAVSVKKSNGRFVVEIPDIAAHKLGTTFTVRLKTSGLTTIVNVSTLSYVQAILSSSKNEKEINAVMALYNYSTAAKAMQ